MCCEWISNDFLVGVMMIIASKHLNIFCLHFLRGGNNLGDLNNQPLCAFLIISQEECFVLHENSYFGESKKSTADHGIEANVLSLVSDSI